MVKKFVPVSSNNFMFIGPAQDLSSDEDSDFDKKKSGKNRGKKISKRKRYEELQHDGTYVELIEDQPVQKKKKISKKRMEKTKDKKDRKKKSTITRNPTNKITVFDFFRYLYKYLIVLEMDKVTNSSHYSFVCH